MDRPGEPAPEGCAERAAASPSIGGQAGDETVSPGVVPDLEAVAEEGRAVEAAAEVPAAGPTSERRPRSDRALLVGLVALALLLGLGWFGSTAVSELRRDLRALDARVAVAQDRAARVESIQARAALLRVRADLDALRQTLAPELAAEVMRADAILGQVTDRIQPAP